MIMNVENPPEVIRLGAKHFLEEGEGGISLWSDADEKSRKRMTGRDMA
jgi:hypothetical protein